MLSKEEKEYYEKIIELIKDIRKELEELNNGK